MLLAGLAGSLSQDTVEWKGRTTTEFLGRLCKPHWKGVSRFRLITWEKARVTYKDPY